MDGPASPIYRQGMRKSRWLIAWIAALLIGAAGAGVAGLVVATVALGVPYLISCRFHPRTAHRACGGSGRHVSSLYPWANRRCRGCGGSGRQVRHGSRAMGMPHVKAEHTASTRAIAKRRQDRTWR